jgi:DNA polymerase (family X)
MSRALGPAASRFERGVSSHNLAIARIFAEIADLLEIKQVSTFRINAYRKAARALEAQGEDVAAMAREHRLRTIPGIGPALAEKIEEYLRTGMVAYQEELRAEFPAGLAALMTIPEVGPKTALLLYQRLGISDVAALEQACRAGRVRDLPRMGARTEQNILAGIERRRQQGTRLALGAVLPHAHVVLDALRAVPGVESLSLAGSIRRMRDTIADIDVVVATPLAEALMDRFVNLPQAAQVLSRGPTRSSIILGTAGIQCDVRAVDPQSYGAALQYFTGSQQHNVQLREMGVRQGLRINEYGVFDVATERKLAGATEKDVYAAVGLDWIPPEIREGQGEIEKARRHTLPTLVVAGDIRGDLHLHTDWSDGQDTAEAMAWAAKARGYEYICVTDHSQSLRFAGGVTADDLRAHAAIVRQITDRVGIQVLIGSEVDILPDGTLDYPEDLLAALDLVIGSVHSRFKMSREEMTRRIIAAMESPHLDVLGHPTGRLIGQRSPLDVDIEALVDAAWRTETVLEINAAPDRLDLPDTHARLARDRGVFLEIGTDAHRKEHLDHMEFGIGTARRAWVEPTQVINAWPIARLMDFLGRGGRP